MLKDRIKLLRTSQNLSQKQLAKIAGICPSSIGHFEGGQREPNVKNLRKICKSLCCSADYLLGLKENDIEIEVFELRSKFEAVKRILGENK